MYWKYGSTIIVTPSIPFNELGSNTDVTLTLVTESGEDLENCYLCVALREHSGYIQAKLSTEEDYQTLYGLFNPNCYLGQINELTETDIDFRINLGTDGPVGTTVMPIIVAHDDGAPLPNQKFVDLDELPEKWVDLEELPDKWVDLEDL